MTIVAVAIKVGDRVFAAPSLGAYSEAQVAAREAGISPSDLGQGVRGFVTDKGAFLDRSAALLHVQRVGQPLVRVPNGLGLHPSDLW